MGQRDMFLLFLIISSEVKSVSEIMSKCNTRDSEGVFKRVALTVVSGLALCQLAGRSFEGKAVEHPTCHLVLHSLALHSS